MKSLNELLELVVNKTAECEEAELILKQLASEKKHLEELAAEALAASGLDRVTYGGRHWRIEVSSHLSVPKDNREAILRAAQDEGIAEELTTINTSTLKAWLVERRKEMGEEDSGSRLTEGTAFDGLVSEYTQSRLRSRAAGT